MWTQEKTNNFRKDLRELVKKNLEAETELPERTLGGVTMANLIIDFGNMGLEAENKVLLRENIDVKPFMAAVEVLIKGAYDNHKKESLAKIFETFGLSDLLDSKGDLVANAGNLTAD